MTIIKNIIKPYLTYVFIGLFIGIFILQPVNDMVIYHVYEATTSTLTSLDFIYDNLIQSFTEQKIKKTLYYAVVGGLIGLLIGFVANIIRSKIETIDSLNEELAKDLDLLISQGEGPSLEFKSSFRWDLKEQRANKSLEGVILKTISGFMNSNGGTLLIGVSDDGLITGIESDYSLLKRKDADGFEQALITVVSTQLGTDLCKGLHILFHQVEKKDVCRVIIKPALRPVYLTHKGSPQLYLRTGGGTRELNIKEAAEYIKGRWK